MPGTKVGLPLCLLIQVDLELLFDQDYPKSKFLRILKLLLFFSSRIQCYRYSQASKLLQIVQFAFVVAAKYICVVCVWYAVSICI